MASLKLKHLCFRVAVFCVAISCCKGQGGGGGGGGAGAGGAVTPGTQDAVQIVAQAALCFDNRQVMNGCLQAMGINVGGSGGGGGNASSPASTSANATASMCSAPCLGPMMLMMQCMNGIMSNFQGYNPGLMQGVQAVFQMACGNGGASNASNQTAASATAASATAAKGGSHVAINESGKMASHGNGLITTLRSGSCMFIMIWTCIPLLLFYIN